jgi:hypothetical protein
MSEMHKDQENGKLSGKDARKNIEQQLFILLTGWKEQLGEKKFKNRIKKAAKLLSKGLPAKKKEAAATKKKTAAVKVKKTKAAEKAATTSKETTA